MKIQALTHRRNLSTRTIAAVMLTVLLVVILPVSTALAAGAGPNFPSIGSNDTGAGTVAWSNPGNITADDNVYSTATLTNGGTVSNYVKGTSFGFSIPADATITGIQVTIGRSGTQVGNDVVQDKVVSLIKAGAITGSNRFSTTTWPTTETPADYGSTSELWGTTWLPADINAANFGVALAAVNIKQGGAPSAVTASVDYIKVAVTYTMTGTTLTVVSASGTFGGTALVTATLTETVGGATLTGKTVDFTLNGISVGSAVTNGTGVATLSSASLSGINAGSYPSGVSANFAGDALFAPSSGTNSLTVSQATPTVSVTGGTVTFNGSAHAASGFAYGVTGLAEVLTPAVTFSYSGTGGTTYGPVATAPTNAGTYSVTASFAGNTNYLSASNSASLIINKAASTVTVVCPVTPETYTGSGIQPCTASYSGAGSLTGSLTPTYSANVNVGTATADATFAGDANHNGSTNSATFSIDKAVSTVTVTCPLTAETYTGSALTPCTASYSGAGSLTGSLTPTYLDNVAVGTATANATYAGDANHNGSSNSATFDISKASSSVTVNCPVLAQTYTGSAIEPCTASYSGAGSLTGSLTPTYASNINVGTATANASYGGDANHNGSSNSATFPIGKAASSVTVDCPAGTQTYTGSALEPCTASYSGAGSLTGSLTPTYSSNINVGTATADASYGGDSNHNGSLNSAAFDIGKAASTVTVTCPVGAQTYTGSALTPCSSSYSGAGSLTGSLAPTYSDNVVVGTATANASYAGDSNHTASTNSATFNIGKAASTVTVTCPLTAETYTGSALTPCTASYAGAGSLTGSLDPIYSDNILVGTATADATFAGDANHNGSTNSATFSIDKAVSTVTVTCPFTAETYTGSALTPCTASYEGVGSLTGSLTPTYLNNVAVGIATANATYAGDANHNGSSNSATFDIGKASSTVTVSCPLATQTYTGSAIEPCTASYSGAGSLSGSLTPTYSNNVNVGVATADASYAGDANHTLSSNSGTFNIGKATATVTLGDLDQTYDGLAKPASAATDPLGLTVELTYNASPTAPTDAGSYTVVATINEANYAGTNTDTLVIHKAVATVSLADLTHVYDGSAKHASATTGPLGLSVDFTYNTSSTAPTNAGSYDVVGTINDTNYAGSDSGTFVISKATPTLGVTNSPTTYDGIAHSATVNAGSVAGTATNILTGGAATQTNAGNYAVTADFTSGDTNYADLTDVSVGSFIINKADPACTINNYSLGFNPLEEHVATGACTGVNGGLDVLAGLNLNGTRHTDPGVYNDHWTFTDVTGNYNNAEGDIVDTVTGSNGLPTTVYLEGVTGTGDISEFVPAGTEVGSLTNDDPDIGDVWTYTLVSGVTSCPAATVEDNAAFTIVGDSLQSTAVFDYELKNSYNICIEVHDAHGAPPVDVPFTISVHNILGAIGSYRSAAIADGSILESGVGSDLGGTVNALAGTIFLGDNAGQRQYRSILSFNTAKLPDTALITKVTLRIRRQGKTNNPFSLGNVLVESKKPYFGSKAAVQAADFQDPGVQSGHATFTDAANKTWYEVELKDAANLEWVNKTGTTQLRLRFDTKTDSDVTADLLKFYSGNAVDPASWPLLVIEYAVPDATLSFKSAAANDGYVTESAMDSGLGGVVNSTGTRGYVGDDAANRQYRSLLSFNTTKLPDTAVVTKVTLKVRGTATQTNQPFSLGNIAVEIKKPFFGTKATLQASDFGPIGPTVGSITNTPDSQRWYSVDLDPSAYASVNLLGTTQLRLSFATSDHDLTADVFKFYTSNSLNSASWPVLIVEYTIP